MIIGLIIGAIWAIMIMSFINDRKREKHREERHIKKWRELQERSIKETGMTIEENLNYEYPEYGENITIKRYIAYTERLLTDLREKIVDTNLSGFYTEQEKINKLRYLENERNLLIKYLKILYDDNIKLPNEATIQQFDKLLEDYINKNK